MGRLPTYAEVQTEGGGSLRDIGTAMRAYRAAQQPAAPTIALPAEVGEAVGALWAAALAVADAKLGIQRDALAGERAASHAELDEGLRVADERIAAATAARDAGLREVEAAQNAAALDRQALAAEAEARRSAEIAAGEARAALATLRDEYAAATAARRQDHERALTEALRQRAEDEERRAAERERAIADELVRYRDAGRLARKELNAVHERALADERAAGELRVADLRATLMGRLEAVLSERDGARRELEATRGELGAALTRAIAAEEVARERAEGLATVRSQLQSYINRQEAVRSTEHEQRSP